ncbi:hypothetical protein BC829DRAFT_440678 [Chytridium lagenaria]|nr:hypothetical protein BC829DRAFT_440678 [Chytridium lagenaria]
MPRRLRTLDERRFLTEQARLSRHSKQKDDDQSVSEMDCSESELGSDGSCMDSDINEDAIAINTHAIIPIPNKRRRDGKSRRSYFRHKALVKKTQKSNRLITSYFSLAKSSKDSRRLDGFKAGSDLPGMKEELHEAVSLPQMYEAGAPKVERDLQHNFGLADDEHVGESSQFTDRSPSSSWQSGYYNSELNEFIHSAVMSTLTERKWFDDGAINILLELDTLGFSDLVYINSTMIQNPPLAHHAKPLSESNITRWMAPVNMGNSHWVLLTAELTLDSGGSKIWGATVWDSRHRQGPVARNFMNIQPSLVACVRFKTNQTYPIEMLSYGVMANQLDFRSCGAYTIELAVARRDLLDLYDMHGVMEDSDDERHFRGSDNKKKPVEKFPNITDEDVRAAKQLNLPPSARVSYRTSYRILNEFGYGKKHHKKGIFMDGHERKDVVSYRQNVFLPKMSEIFRVSPDYTSADKDKDDMGVEMIPELQSGEKLVRNIFQDEAIFYSNDNGTMQWCRKGEQTIMPKTKGEGIMVSAFLLESHGILKDEDNDEPTVFMKIGKGRKATSTAINCRTKFCKHA